MPIIPSVSHGYAPSRPRWLIPCSPFSCPLKPRAYPGLVTHQKKKESRVAPSSCCFHFGVTFHHLSHCSGILPTLPTTLMMCFTSNWQSLPPFPMPSSIPGAYPRIAAFCCKGLVGALYCNLPFWHAQPHDSSSQLVCPLSCPLKPSVYPCLETGPRG